MSYEMGFLHASNNLQLPKLYCIILLFLYLVNINFWPCGEELFPQLYICELSVKLPISRPIKTDDLRKRNAPQNLILSMSMKFVIFSLSRVLLVYEILWLKDIYNSHIRHSQTGRALLRSRKEFGRLWVLLMSAVQAGSHTQSGLQCNGSY